MNQYDVITATNVDKIDAANSHKLAVHLTEAGGPPENGPNFLEMISGKEFNELMGRAPETSYRRGEHFFTQGDEHDGIHFIRSGRVRSYYTSPSGREITLAYWPAGHFVGAPQILGGGSHMWSSVAVEASVGLRLPGRVLRSLIHDQPELAIGLIEGLVHKSMCYTSLLQIMGTQSKTSRLGHLLLTFATPVNQNSGVKAVNQHFTQEELANMVGSTRQSISNSLDKFEKRGFIKRNGDVIEIVDDVGLRSLCR